jgi:hypothetical protein
VLDQLEQPPQARLWRQVVTLLLPAQDTHQLLQVGDGLAAGRLHRSDGRDGLGGVAVEQPAGDPGLHAHHAHMVGDHVVQFPGDPDPLLQYRPAGVDLPLLVELAVALLQRRPVLAQPAHHRPQRPGEQERQRIEHDDGRDLDHSDGAGPGREHHPGADQPEQAGPIYPAGSVAVGVGSGAVDGHAEDHPRGDLVDLPDRPVAGEVQGGDGQHHQRPAAAQDQGRG